ncbi:MAG: hypothetical protein H2055_08300 [Sphingopyxis sp.]|nr:hypothetical protein [Sphingopyxis sp.]
MMKANFQSEAQEAGFGDAPWTGVFLMRGQSLDISAFEISIDDDGNVSSTSPTLSTSTHMTPHWLEAAIDHARAVQRRAAETNEAFRGEDADAKARCLNAELIASMQAIACSAFAIDALHASLLKVQPTPAPTREAWRRNRTKRSRQIFETLRRAFKFGKQASSAITTYLDQLSTARDVAVHPPSRSKPAERHSRLPVSVDPAFNLFRAHNAIVCVGMAVRLIDQFSKAETAKDPKVAKRMAELRELILPLKRRWDRTSAGRKFKELLRQADASSAAP